MPILSQVCIARVAFIHFYIVHLEMVLWNTPKGHKAFNLKPDFAAQTKVLTTNQGLYNGFLAVGLVWALIHSNPVMCIQIATFFVLYCCCGYLWGNDRCQKNHIHTNCARHMHIICGIFAATHNCLIVQYNFISKCLINTAQSALCSIIKDWNTHALSSP